MKIGLYSVRLVDTFILGPSISFEEGQTRIGLCLVGFEIGMAIDKVIEDYVITDENREHAVDEIIGELKGEGADDVEANAVRSYANRLLDESDNWGKQELAASVVAYSEGFADAKKKGERLL